jgi:hypothetical protein
MLRSLPFIFGSIFWQSFLLLQALILLLVSYGPLSQDTPSFRFPEMIRRAAHRWNGTPEHLSGPQRLRRCRPPAAPSNRVCAPSAPQSIPFPFRTVQDNGFIRFFLTITHGGQFAVVPILFDNNDFCPTGQQGKLREQS